MQHSSQQQLQRHKDTVRDTLQGLLDTIGQIPGLIHDSSSKELSAVISATAIREGAFNRTQQSLDALPAELSAFDQVLDEVLARSHDISQGLSTLRAFNSRPSARPTATTSNQQQQQQQPKQQQTGRRGQQRT